MALLQKKLREDLPYGRVFQGTGEQDRNDVGVRFYQHGLYFDAKGDLAIDSPHNAEKIALFKKLGENPMEKKEALQKDARPTVNPEIIAQLAPMDDDEIYAIAVNLTKVLVEKEKPFGEYVPSVDARDQNIEFIAEFTV
jgi:hypothetical protein